jgi:glycerol-3-phosphate acyltransferase PlsY
MGVSLLIAAVGGYLLGSLPFGYLVARARGVNIFEVGSKNPGATNVRRVLGHGPGNVVLVLDALKGALAAGWPQVLAKLEWGAALAPGQREGIAITGLVAAILGHSFSCFTGFRGGKSVATGAGGFAVVFPPGMLVGLVAFGAILALTRYVSLASMVGAVALPVTAIALGRSPVLIGVAVAITGFVVWRHRANISRLLAGTETRIGRPPAVMPPPS